MRFLAIILVLLSAPATAARADTVVLKNGKKFRHVVVSRNDDQYVVSGDQDPRFRYVSPKARRILVEKLARCLVTYADPAGIPLLERIRRSWPEDARIQNEVERALTTLAGR